MTRWSGVVPNLFQNLVRAGLFRLENFSDDVLGSFI